MGQTHKDITTDSITELDKEFFGVAKLTKGMKKAIDQIAAANAKVDDDQGTAALHFDGEAFATGHQRLEGLFQGVITALQSDDVGGARSQLGQALHTAQDFYSHSNWIELGNGSANPATWREGQSVSPASPPSEATCAFCFDPCRDCDSNLRTGNITSGYYGGEDATKPIPGKCNHGGLFDSLGSGGINKDTVLCDFSPHSNLHASAAQAARDATQLFIRDLKARITFKQLKELLGAGPTLAMSIDTTGSMGPIIADVRTQAIQIVDDRLGTDEEPTQYVLAPFNDPFTGPLTVTSDATVFKAAISALGAFGGGDCPELSMTGALQALQASEEGIDLFTFTDASSKDGSLAGLVGSLAAEKDAKIYPILFGACSPIDPAYVRLANESGGQLFFLRFAEAGLIARLADFVVRSNAVDVLSIGDTLSGVAKSYDFPVDAAMTRLTVSVSGAIDAIVRRPDGTTVQGTDPGVTLLALSSGRVYSIVTPTVGLWNVTVNGSGELSVSVSGESDLTFDSFRFVELAGRPGHQGLFPIAGFPVTGSPATAHAELSGDIAAATFELRTKAGQTIQALNLIPDTPGSLEFFGDVALPDTPFLVYATGTDGAGDQYQRVLTTLTRTQTVRIVPPSPLPPLPAGRTTTFDFRVENVGSAADTFRFTATDSNRFLSGITPASFTLPPGGNVVVSVSLTVPAGVPAGTTETLTVTVDGSSGARNFAVVRSQVETNRPPIADAGADQTVECSGHSGASAMLNGSASSDPDGDTLSFEWKDENGNVLGTTAIVSATVPLGMHPFTLTVTDPAGLSSTAATRITVRDVTRPVIASLTAEPRELRPQNKLVPVKLKVSVNDACDANPAGKIISVVRKKDDDDDDDDDRARDQEARGSDHDDDKPDWIITGDLTLKLRAKRGHVYVITVRCTDSSGNRSTKAVTVKVRRDKED